MGNFDRNNNSGGRRDFGRGGLAVAKTDRDKCMMQSAVSAAKIAKSLLGQVATDLFFAATVLRRTPAKNHEEVLVETEEMTEAEADRFDNLMGIATESL